MPMAVQNMKPTSLLKAACLPCTQWSKTTQLCMVLRGCCSGQPFTETRSAQESHSAGKWQQEARVCPYTERGGCTAMLQAGRTPCRCLGAQQAVSPHVAHGGLRSRDAPLPCSLPLPELHAGTRSLRRRRPRRRRPPCSMLPPRWSPAALAAGQTPAPEGGNKLNNSRREDPAGLAGAACARGQTVT